MSIIKKAISKYLKRYEIKNLPSEVRTVYLTFDDGPEPGITEFVLNELDKHTFKATFFCRGDNAEKYPELLALLQTKGHSVANHSYSHIYADEVPARQYLADVERANDVLHTSLFRPPRGNLTLRTWLGLRKKYTVVYWALNSGDSLKDKFNYQQAIDNLTSNTKPGDVVLFHFCQKHEKETRMLLPVYLEWLNEQGFIGKTIPE